MEIPVQRITLHGHEMAYRLSVADEPRPTILLIHGMAGNSDTWREVMPELAKNHTVLAPDLLGHGESAKPTGDYSLGAHASGLRDLLAALGLGPVTVVGQSLGGGVAMQLGYQHPEEVERLVLIGSGGLGREVSWLLRALTFPGAEYVMPFIFHPLLRDQGESITRVLRKRGWESPRATEMLQVYGSITEAANRAAFVRTLRSVIDPGGQSVNATDRLHLTAATPTLIVWGEDDNVIPVDHAHAAHEAIPGSRLQILEGVGHFPHLERPKQVIEVIEDFIDTTEPVPGGMSPKRS